MNLPSLSVGSTRDESPVLHSDTSGGVWTATTVVSDADVEAVYSVIKNIRLFRRNKKKTAIQVYGKLKIFRTELTQRIRYLF